MAQNEVLSIPRAKHRVVVELMTACLGSCFLAVMSQIAIPLSMTPIPVTLQTFAVFLLGGVLGSRRAVYSVLAYLIQGCCLLPVFAGGVSNPLWILGPHAGFLISFAVGAYIIGKMIEKHRKRSIFYILMALASGQMAIFAIGMGWLSFYIGLEKAFLYGVLPFLPGAALKITAASVVIRGYHSLRKES
jgi:biotin transport system substrate-specific component